MKNIIKKIKFRLALVLFYIFSKLPKKNIVVFESFFGSRIDDNTHNIIKLFPNKTKYVVCKKLGLFDNDIDTENTYFVKKRSLKYYYLMHTSKYIVTNSRLHAGLSFKSKHQTVIQLWHGIPWKKLAFDQDNKEFGFQQQSHYLKKFYKDVRKWDYLWVPSVESKKRLSKAFKFENKFIEAMYPADVNLLNSCVTSKCNSKYKKTVLYMPTFRENKIIEAGSYEYYQNFDFNEFCKKHSDILFLVKTHYLVSSQIDFDLENVIKVSDDESLNDLYLKSDILITDYSSALFSFSLLEKPVIAICCDIDEYSKTRGLYDDAVDNMNLNFIYNTEDLGSIDFLNLKTSKTNQEFFTKEYEEIIKNTIK